jgi:hypothetical protein
MASIFERAASLPWAEKNPGLLPGANLASGIGDACDQPLVAGVNDIE